MKKQLRNNIFIFVLSTILIYSNAVSSIIFEQAYSQPKNRYSYSASSFGLTSQRDHRHNDLAAKWSQEIISYHQRAATMGLTYEQVKQRAARYNISVADYLTSYVEAKRIEEAEQSRKALQRQQAEAARRSRQAYQNSQEIISYHQRAAAMGLTYEQVKQRAAGYNISVADYLTSYAEAKRIEEAEQSRKALQRQQAEAARKTREANQQHSQEIISYHQRAAAMGLTYEQVKQRAAGYNISVADYLTSYAEAKRIEEAEQSRKALQRQQAEAAKRTREANQQHSQEIISYHQRAAAMGLIYEQVKQRAAEYNISVADYLTSYAEAKRIEEAEQSRKALQRQQAEAARRSRQAYQHSQEDSSSQLMTLASPYQNVNKANDVYGAANIFRTNIKLFEDNINRTARINNKQLKFVPSSARNNNCLLYSIVRDDEDYLEKIMEDRETARTVLAAPEHSSTSPKRDFNPVRKKIFRDIIRSFGESFKKSTPNSEGHVISIKEAVDDIKNMDYPQYKNLTVENFLGILVQSDSKLIEGFADIISVLYGRPVYVMIPTNNGPEVNMNNGQYYDLSDLPGEPIFVYHQGTKGNHYSKLIPIE